MNTYTGHLHKQICFSVYVHFPYRIQNTLQHTAIHCNTLQHTATHCNTLQHTATHCNTLSISNRFECKWPVQMHTKHTQINMYNHTSYVYLYLRVNIKANMYFIIHKICKNTSVYIWYAIDVYINININMYINMNISMNTLQHAATQCNTLQHTATHCNMLQHAATCCNTLLLTATHCNTLQHTATHCNTLQHTATVKGFE